MNSGTWPRVSTTMALCAVLATPSLAFAQFTARVVTGAAILADGRVVEHLVPDVAFCAGCPVAASQSEAFIIGNATSRSEASGTALADYGTLKVLAQGSMLGPFAYSDTTSTAEFSDAFTISAAGLAGRHGTVVLTIDTRATLQILGEGTIGSLSTRLQTFGSSDKTWLQAADYFGDGRVVSRSSYPGIGPVPYSPTLVAAIDIVFGDSLSFLATLSARVRGDRGNLVGDARPGTFLIDASHSAYWGGFLSVLDGDGAAVDAYTVSSSSGIDWSRSVVPLAVSPVPEPETFTLLLAGLFAVRFVSARRRAI